MGTTRGSLMVYTAFRGAVKERGDVAVGGEAKLRQHRVFPMDYNKNMNFYCTLLFRRGRIIFSISILLTLSIRNSWLITIHLSVYLSLSICECWRDLFLIYSKFMSFIRNMHMISVG
ncbi:hypothetical protein E2C01_102649 [Portunus trituberculatus]|uniref:Uncharacterized protein n=1 Tax=Portunus trituberculatus TaxID=210409 RepID=A0A5B7KHU8_PORTR|nr:hypothetical protein [Portunus trituberculatus]